MGCILVSLEMALAAVWHPTFRVPSLTMLLVIYCGVRWGSDIGAFLGFVLGVLIGLLRLEPLGGSALIGTLVGFTAGYFYGKLYVGQYLALMLIAGILIFFAETINGCITWFLYNHFTSPDLGWVITNMVCSLPLFFICEFILRPRTRTRYLMHLK
jgi:rod shape-determining protein MreD